MLKTDARAVLAHRCDWEGRTVLAVHNLGAETEFVKIDAGEVDPHARVDDLLDGEEAAVELAGSLLELKLEGYGYRWFRLTPAERPAAP